MSDKSFYNCEKCNKRLIERKPNGIWHFVFGGRPEGGSGPPVDMKIHGSIQMKCLRQSCGHINLLTFLPNSAPIVMEKKQASPAASAE
jgi:hypothetical protein